MDYIQSNKLAWEDAFRHRKPGWGDDNAARLLSEHLPFLHPDIVRALESMDFRGKTVAQFCCNNGRELLSLMQLGTRAGIWLRYRGKPGCTGTRNGEGCRRGVYV